MELDLIGQKLEVFSRKTLQEVLTVRMVLETEGISFEELQKYLNFVREKAQSVSENKVKEMKKFEEEAKIKFAKWREKVRKCPDCGTSLNLTKISELKGKGNREGWRSHWTCPNENCFFEEYSKEYADKLYTETMEG